MAGSPAAHAAVADDPWQLVDDGIWRLTGIVEANTATNRGRTQNTWLIADAGKAIIVDPGPEAAIIRDALAKLPPGLRVVAAFNTHPHPENVLGNSGLPDELPLWSSRQTARLMHERCEGCRYNMMESLQMPVLATQAIRVPAPGTRDDKQWHRVVALPFAVMLRQGSDAHSDADTLMWLPEQKVLVTGGVFECGAVPLLTEGDISTWRDLLEILVDDPQFAQARVIGGTGGVCSIDGLIQAQAYLRDLEALIVRALDQGDDPASASDTLRLPQYVPMAAYAWRHPINVQRLWRVLEDAMFEQADNTDAGSK